MRAWVLQIVSATTEVPSVVWGAVLGASIAGTISYITTRATNKNSRGQLRMQLANDALQRDRERTMTLRRDVYLPAAEAIVRAQQALGESMSCVSLVAPYDVGTF